MLPSKSPVRAAGAACVLAAAVVASPSAYAFDAAALSGLWAESQRGRYACTPDNRYQRFTLSDDGRTLTMFFDSRSKRLPDASIRFEVVRAEEHSLLLRSVVATAGASAAPVRTEWLLSLLGPGAYRWLQVRPRDDSRPAAIGVRCAM